MKIHPPQAPTGDIVTDSNEASRLFAVLYEHFEKGTVTPRTARRALAGLGALTHSLVVEGLKAQAERNRLREPKKDETR